MAFMTCHIFSHVLSSNITFNISLPTPTSGDRVNYETLAHDFGYDQGLPVVYLLHGMFGDADSWVRFSNVDRYAQDRHLCAVMCSAGNNFYQNMADGPAMETFFTKELPAYICSLFPVSQKREDTFIAGFSMGGYGALHLALKAPERYSKAASMSGALDLPELVRESRQETRPSPFHWNAIFGNKENLEGSGSDLFAQMALCQEKGCIPDLFITCGREDFLYDMNLKARDRMISMGLNPVFTEGPGGHDWTYWDTHIQEVMDWLLQDRIRKQSAVIMG